MRKSKARATSAWMPRAPRHTDATPAATRVRDASTLSEADVSSALSAACALRGWTAVRFVDADRAERSGRPVVAVATTRPWAEWFAAQPTHQAGVELRPYGVRHHTLLVGARWTDTPGVHVRDPFEENA